MNSILIWLWVAGSALTFVPWARAVYNREPSTTPFAEIGKIPHHNKGTAIGTASLYCMCWPVFAAALIVYGVCELAKKISGYRPINYITDLVVGRKDCI